MAHQRELIRHAVVATLLAANTAAEDRVQGTRVDPWSKKLPCISVYTLTDEVDAESAESAPRELLRKAKLEIVGCVAHTDAVPADDAMDALADQVEAAMDANRYLVVAGENMAADTVLEATELQVIEDDGRSDPLVGIVTLTYAVTYRTSPGSVVATDDFLRADVTHQLAGGLEDDTVPAEDLVNVRSTP